MAVVSSKQTDEDLKVLNYAEDLLEYTFDICHREKNVTETKDGQKTKAKASVFPKKYWSCFTSHIIELAASAYEDLYWANEVRLDRSTTPEMFRERISHQERAIASLKTMLPKITFAWHRFSISTNSIEYWTGLIVKTVNKAKNWSNSNKRRYEDLQK